MLKRVQQEKELKLQTKLKNNKMQDNFDTHKWFKKQYLNESDVKEGLLGLEQIDRFESTANIRDLKTLQDMIRIVGTDWMQEGFEKGDIKEYINYLIDGI
jgi:hypothetical protein